MKNRGLNGLVEIRNAFYKSLFKMFTKTLWKIRNVKYYT